MYAIDTSSNKDWEQWQPKAKSDKGSEIDTAASQLEVNGQAFPSFNGYCWVDMNALIQECERLVSRGKGGFVCGVRVCVFGG